MQTELPDPLYQGMTDLQALILCWQDRLPPKLANLVRELDKLKRIRAEELLRRRTQDLSWDDLFE